ncbi:DegT/DnrJ/EryC1/StrS family aminotransferase [Candidatus Omnitrophota bacterium]
MINVAKPLVGKEELRGIKKVLESGWLGMGDKVFQLENELRKMFKRKYAICVNTGTTAIHLALDAIGIKKGDEVIVPSLTYIATIQPIIACGGKPVFCDVEMKDLNMSPAHLRKLITKKTKAIIPVHYGGVPCEMNEILKLARKNKIHVIEDAAHAFGSKYHGKLIGSFGDITCFSFDPIKNMTCGEGGVMLLDDKRLAEIIVKKRILGVDKDTWNRYKHKRSWLYEVHVKGYRYHMNNINAAIGLAQLEKLKRLSERRQEIARFYDRELSGVKGVELLSHKPRAVIPFNYTILTEKRDDLMIFLKAKGVGTVINYIPNHLQPLFRNQKTKLPNTEKAYKEIISIPMHSGLTLKDARYVVRTIKEFYAK